MSKEVRGTGEVGLQNSESELGGSMSEIAINTYRIERFEADLKEMKAGSETLNFTQIKQMFTWIGLPVVLATSVFGVSLWQTIQTSTKSAAELRAAETVGELTEEIDRLQGRVHELQTQSEETVREMLLLRGRAGELARSVQLQADNAEVRAIEAVRALDTLRRTAASADDIQRALGDVEEIASQLAKNEEFQEQISQSVLGGFEGMVATFDKSSGCPPGWSQFLEASGRAIIGVGQGSIDQIGDQDILLTERRWREFGGEETHTLTVNEMPSHSHAGDVGVPGYRAGMLNEPRYHNGQHQAIGSSGGGRPHNNMPPFIALYFCERG